LARQGGRGKYHDRRWHAFVESDDLQKDFADLKARGVKSLEPEPKAYPYGMRVTAFDPDGNPIALRQTRK